MTGILISHRQHLLLAHLTRVLHAEGVVASELLVEVTQDDELGMLDVVTAFHHRPFHVLATQMHVVGIIALAALATEYPVE